MAPHNVVTGIAGRFEIVAELSSSITRRSEMLFTCHRHHNKSAQSETRRAAWRADGRYSQRHELASTPWQTAHCMCILHSISGSSSIHLSIL